MSVQVANSGGSDPKLGAVSVKSTKTIATQFASSYNLDGFSQVTVNPVQIYNVINTATYSIDGWNAYKATCTLPSQVTINTIWRIFWCFFGAVSVSSFSVNQVCGIFIPASNINISVMSWGSMGFNSIQMVNGYTNTFTITVVNNGTMQVESGNNTFVYVIY